MIPPWRYSRICILYLMPLWGCLPRGLLTSLVPPHKLMVVLAENRQADAWMIE